MAAMEKVFSCMSCGESIKLERKPDDSGWLKWNLDGTKHVDSKKSKHQQQEQPQATALGNGPQMAELAKQVSDLKDTVNVLISQIQMLRSEVKSKNCNRRE
jgi:hypothetical protein